MGAGSADIDQTPADVARAPLDETRLGLRLCLHGFLVGLAWSVLRTGACLVPGAGAGWSLAPQALLASVVLASLIALAWQKRMDRLRRDHFLAWSLGIAAVVTAALAALPASITPAALLIWSSVFGALALTQYWSLIDDILEPRTARRQLGLIGAGPILGGTLGGALGTAAAMLAGTGSVTWLAAALMLAAVPAVLSVHCLECRMRGNLSQGCRPPSSEYAQLPGYFDGPRLLRYYPVLPCLLGLAVLSGAVTALLDGQLSAALLQHDEHGLAAGRQSPAVELPGLVSDQLAGLSTLAPRPFETLASPASAGGAAGFAALVLTLQNLASLCVQLLLVRWLLAGPGVGVCLLALPVLTLVGGLLILAAPGFWLLPLLTALDGCAAVTVTRSARELLFLPLPREAKYKAKPFVDAVAPLAGLALGAAATAWLLPRGPGSLRMAGGLVAILSTVEVGLALAAIRAYAVSLRQAIDRHAQGMTQMGSGFFQRLIVTEGGAIGEPSRQKLNLELASYYMGLMGKPLASEPESGRKLARQQERQLRRIFALLGQLDDPRDIGRAFTSLKTFGGSAKGLAVELLELLLRGRERALVVAMVDDELDDAERIALAKRVLALDERSAHDYVQGVLRSSASDA